MAEATYFGAHLANGFCSPSKTQAPIRVIGGGLVGMALALALARQGFASGIHDLRPRGAARRDPRVIALSHGSQQFFEWLGCWSAIAPSATAIDTIHISQKNGFGRTRIRAAEEGVSALGQVVPASKIAAALDDALDAAGVRYFGESHIIRSVQMAPGALQIQLIDAQAQPHCTPLAVYAEGGISEAEENPIRHRDYGQHALICTVTADQPHAHTAWERFTPQGPLALLPLHTPNAYSVVYTCSPEEAAQCQTQEEAVFLKTIQAHFGHRLSFSAVRDRHVFPLGLRYRVSPVGERCVWLGNAAQTLHPVAGQGFNLALRDVMALAQTLAGQADPGQPEVLARYAAARRIDRQGVIGLTDGLVRLFSNDLPVLREGRGLALLALDLLPPLRGFLARRMMYGMRGL